MRTTLVLLLAAACSGSDESADGGVPSGEDAAGSGSGPISAADASIKQQVGPEGAVFAFDDDAELLIPPGALPQGAEITASLMGLSYSGAEVGEILRLEPSGLFMRRPAALTIRREAEESDFTLAFWNPELELYQEMETELGNGTFVASIDHFTDYAVIGVSDNRERDPTAQVDVRAEREWLNIRFRFADHLDEDGKLRTTVGLLPLNGAYNTLEWDLTNTNFTGAYAVEWEWRVAVYPTTLFAVPIAQAVFTYRVVKQQHGSQLAYVVAVLSDGKGVRTYDMGNGVAGLLSAQDVRDLSSTYTPYLPVVRYRDSDGASLAGFRTDETYDVKVSGQFYEVLDRDIDWRWPYWTKFARANVEDVSIPEFGPDDDADNDSDGSPAAEDCDDHDVFVTPAGPELCNGIDDNCDGVTDEDCSPQACKHECSFADVPGTGDTVFCSEDLGQTWDCRNADVGWPWDYTEEELSIWLADLEDRGLCWEEVWTACPEGTTCVRRNCVPTPEATDSTCMDECEAGESGCSEDRRSRWTCAKSGVLADCRVPSLEACAAGEICVEGQCEQETMNCSADDTILVVSASPAFFMDKYEASRPDANGSDPGSDDSLACSVEGVLPWTNVTYFQARQACEQAGKRLCTSDEWSLACSGDPDWYWRTPWTSWHAYPYGSEYQDGACNFGTDQLAPTGDHEACASPDGAMDMLGNVAEWRSMPGHSR